MNFQSFSLEQLRSEIDYLESLLRNREHAEHQEINLVTLNLLKSEFDIRAKDALIRYREVLRPSHIYILKELQSLHRADLTDVLVQRAYICAYYGICISTILQRPEFHQLRPYYPSMRLPLDISESDIQAYESELYRSVPLKQSVENFILDYKPLLRGRAEEFLKKLWGPLLQSFFCSLKLRLGISDLHIIPEFSSKNIPGMDELRFFDFAVADGHEGLPVLVVEMSANPVNTSTGQIHKDMRKMAITMSQILMTIIQRSKSHCPDDDITKFRVFGLLIGGSEFECCVGSVIQNQNGQVSFVFNCHGDWKFDLFKSSEEYTHISQNLCTGDLIEVGTPVDDSNLLFDTNSHGAFTDPSLFTIISEEESNQNSEDGFVQIDHRLVVSEMPNSAIILWKFIYVALDYYCHLDECLKECIQVAPQNLADVSLNFQLPPKTLRPTMASSSSRHSGTSIQGSPDSITMETMTNNSDQQGIYEYLSEFKFQTLPDVLFYSDERKIATIRTQFFGLDSFSDLVKRAVDNGKDDEKRLTQSQISLLDSKFILDMILAAYKLHSKDLVCRGFDPVFIGYDGLFFHLTHLPSLVHCSVIGKVPCENFDPIYHLASFGKRDDLYSIARCALLDLKYYLGMALGDCKLVPLFQKFLEVSINKMFLFEKYPELNAADILKDIIPIYDEMIRVIPCSKFKGVMATQVLAKKTLKQIQGMQSFDEFTSSAESIEKAGITVSNDSKTM